MKKIIETKAAPAPVGPYSQAIQSGPFLFCSGQIAIVPETGDIISGDAQKETEQVMKNVEAVLKEAGLGFENVIKSMIFLTDMADFPVVNEIYGARFPENPPARSCVAVKQLPKGVTVEVEVIAALP